MNKEALKALSDARARLLLDFPFFGALALRLVLQEDESIPTLAVDGRRMYYNPKFFLSLPPNLRRSAVAHEVVHCAMGHIFRRGAREPLRWNQAIDYATNALLKDAGMPLGDSWLYHPAFENQTAEYIYDRLPNDAGAPLCHAYQPNEGPGRGQPDAHGTGTDDLDDLTIEWKLATIQAAKDQAARGSLSANLRKLLDDAIAPPVPWKDILASFMTERARDDYSWRRPNPYYASSGIYLPIMDGVAMGEVVIAMDTSGSVVSVLDEFGSTVKDVLASAMPSRVHLVYCDAAVNRVSTYERGETPSFEAVGGGGTDFRPVFDYVQEHGIRPACLLYLTDMYGSFPQDAPDYPVLWCATTDRVAPFGQTLRIR